MNLFHIIEGGVAIISVAGKYQQVGVYQRGSDVFVDVGKSNYVKLLAMNGTSVPNTKWWDIDATNVKIARIGAPEYHEKSLFESLQEMAMAPARPNPTTKRKGTKHAQTRT